MSFRLIATTFLVVVSVCSVSNAAIIGHFNTSREQFGLAGTYISTAKADLGTQGHTLSSTGTITSGFLGGVDIFYAGLLRSGGTSAAERTALQNWVQAGGYLIVQQDHTGGAWYNEANTVLADYGVHTTGSTGNLHTVMSSSTDPVATSPNDIRGQTIVGSANSYFDLTGSLNIVAASNDDNRAILLAGSSGSGRIITISDIDFFSGARYDGNQSNRDLWENMFAGSRSNVIPEPSSIAIFTFMGMIMIGLVWYRKRQAAV